MISVILPTYNESDNIKVIIPKISELFRAKGMRGEIIVVDDNSPDGTAKAVKDLAKEYEARVHVRKTERGLATAVMKGFQLAKGDIIVVMDADLSHPLTKIPEMVNPIIQRECDATVGSRYIHGGGSAEWPLSRKIVSKGAGLFARGLTKLSDPTSGFMAFGKKILDGVKLDPVGWKIVLEVLVKTNCTFKEVPIIFSDRAEGESKLNFKAQIDYLRHLWRLYDFKYLTITQFIKFCIVGFLGVFVDTTVLVSLVELASFDPRFAAIFAFLAAVTFNYVLNRLWTFAHGKYTKISYSYPSFIAVSMAGLGIRIGVMHLLIEYAGMGKGFWYIFASLSGIVAGTIFNFLGSKYIAFSTNLSRRQIDL